MRITGIEIFLESHNLITGTRMDRLGVVPMQIPDTTVFDHLMLRIQFKPQSGGVEEYFLHLDSLRRRKD